MKLRITALAVAASLVACGGVPQAKYDQLVLDDQFARQNAAKAKEQDDRYIAELKASLKATEGSAQTRDQKMSELTTQNHNCQVALDQATAMNQQLRAELERTGKDVDKILSDRGRVAKELDDARTRLAELRRAQSVAEARVALFKSFAERFQPLIDAKQLEVGSRGGRLAIIVPGDVLFDRGKTDVKGTGVGVLLEIAKVLGTSNSRKFEVGVHTDGSPPGNARAPTNWELSAMRAVEVARLLVSNGVKAESLSASGYADGDPADPNDAAKNRRVEIALRPSAEDTVAPPAR